jgi:hypothetical protein
MLIYGAVTAAVDVCTDGGSVMLARIVGGCSKPQIFVTIYIVTCMPLIRRVLVRVIGFIIRWLRTQS